MSKYSTEELVNIITCAFKDRVFLRKDCLAIIAKLRAADKLCDAAKEVEEFLGHCELDIQLSKAIADYEGRA